MKLVPLPHVHARLGYLLRRQTFSGWFVALLVWVMSWCDGGQAQSLPASILSGPRELPVPAGAKITLEFDRSDYFLGENVLAHFLIENTGKTPFQISQGGDYRGAGRNLRFQVTATDETGHLVEDPDPDPICMGGIGNKPTIKPGERFIASVPLTRYRKFDTPGKYTVRVSHDLGWKAGPVDGELPGASGTITFQMPNDAQAEAIVARMESLPANPSISQGQRSPDYADFTALRQPVYLTPLLRRAKQGDTHALEAISGIETPMATDALIRLADAVDARFALQAALALVNRLPLPQAEGPTQAGKAPDSPWTKKRRQLSQRSWSGQFPPEVRRLATRLLARSEPRDVSVGAAMIEAIGRPDDAPAVFTALDAAIDKTLNPRRNPEDNILNDPEPLPNLLRAMRALQERGYTLANNLSGHARILLDFVALDGQKGPRPADWQQSFDAYGTSGPYAVREAALRSVPFPLPEACVPRIQAALADQDLGVCLVACEVAGKSGDKRFLAPLIEIIATENHEWLLRAATNAAAQLGAGFELQQTWADRLGDEHLYPLALDSLQAVLDVKSHGSSGRIDLNRTERLHLREVWRAFLRRHEKALRAGKRFKLDDPAVKPELFGRARVLRLDDGSEWPPGRPDNREL